MKLGRKRYQTLSFDDFSIGLYQRCSGYADFTGGDAALFGLRSAAIVNNVICDKGRLAKFNGFQRILAANFAGDPVVTGVYEYVKEGVTREAVTIVTADNKVYKVSGGTATLIYTGITPNVLFSFVTYNNLCIMVNGVDAPLQFDGTTCAAITFIDPGSNWPAPRPLWAKIFRGRLFYSGDNARPYSLFTPKPETHNDFSSFGTESDEIVVSAGDGQRVMGLEALTKDILVIAKRGSMHRLSGFNPFGAGSDAFTVEEISRSIGCVSGHSIVSVANDIMFLSDDGMKSISTVDTYGDVSVNDPFYVINKEVEGINFTPSAVEKAFARFDRKLQYLYVHVPTGSSTTNDAMYVIDIKTGAIMKRSGIISSCGAIVDQKYVTGGYTGNIFLHGDSESYDGEAIESVWESQWLSFGDISDKKVFHELNVYFEAQGNSTPIVQYQIMKNDLSYLSGSKAIVTGGGAEFDVDLWDSAVFDTVTDTFARAKNLGRGRAIKIRIMNNQPDQPWEVSKVEFSVMNLGRVSAY